MNKALAAIVFVVIAAPAWAQMTPVGHWQTIDEKTKEVKSQVHISESGGMLTGKIEKLLRKDAKQDAVCDECSDDRKGQPMLIKLKGKVEAYYA